MTAYRQRITSPSGNRKLIDFIVLQQDAFDDIDSVTPIERQKYILDLVTDICRTDFEFDHFDKVADFFKELINIGRQMNYSEFRSDKFNEYRKQLDELIDRKKVIQ